MLNFPRLLALPPLLGLVAFAGCGEDSSGVPVTQENRFERILNDVGEMYRQHAFAAKKPPRSLADFAQFESAAPLGLKALREGEVVARSNVVIQDFEEGPAANDPADQVMAYVKDAPTAGGLVLMNNRTLRTMKADEFKAAKLAGDGVLAAKK